MKLERKSRDGYIYIHTQKKTQRDTERDREIMTYMVEFFSRTLTGKVNSHKQTCITVILRNDSGHGLNRKQTNVHHFKRAKCIVE